MMVFIPACYLLHMGQNSTMYSGNQDLLNLHYVQIYLAYNHKQNKDVTKILARGPLLEHTPSCQGRCGKILRAFTYC